MLRNSYWSQSALVIVTLVYMYELVFPGPESESLEVELQGVFSGGVQVTPRGVEAGSPGKLEMLRPSSHSLPPVLG